MLILAGISIAMLTGDNGLLTKATTAKGNTERATAEEEVKLEVFGSYDDNGEFDYETFKTNVENNLGATVKDNGDGTCTVTHKGYDVIVNTTTGTVMSTTKTGETPPALTLSEVAKAKQDGTVFGENKELTDDEGKKVWVPEGYRIADDSKTAIKDGVVITDAVSKPDTTGNEFVWIPVDTIADMAEKITVDGNAKDANDNDNYRGVLYDWNADPEGNVKITYSEKGNREPSNLSTTYDSKDNNSDWEPTLYQEEYNKMAKSVEQYHGFYVGRYEMSVSDDTNKIAQSKKNKTSANASQSEKETKAWYRLYNKAKTYAPEEDTSKKVVSSMIWGSQYDAMMKWMIKNGIEVYSDDWYDYEDYNISDETGKVDTDCLNEVYDLIGNRYEWTQEAYGTNSRVDRRRRLQH